MLNNIPIVSIDYVFSDRSCFDEAKHWLENRRDEIIEPKREEADG